MQETLRDSLLSLAETQRAIAVSRASLFRLIAKGDIPVIEILGRTLVDPDDLRQYVESRKRRRGPAQNDESPDSTGLLATTSAGAGGGDVEV